MCSEKFCKFHLKTPVLESLFDNKVAGLLRSLRATFFTEHFRWLLLTKLLFNPFHITGLFLRFSDVFNRYEKRPVE